MLEVIYLSSKVSSLNYCKSCVVFKILLSASLPIKNSKY